MFEDANEDDFTSVVSMLVCNGVQAIDAQRLVTSMVKGVSFSESKTGFVELYVRGRLTRAAGRYKGLDVHGLEVWDLRKARPDGETWRCSRLADRRWALKLLREHQPMRVIAAPPCTAVSMNNHNWNYQNMAEGEVKRRIEGGGTRTSCVQNLSVPHAASKICSARTPPQCTFLVYATHPTHVE